MGCCLYRRYMTSSSGSGASAPCVASRPVPPIAWPSGQRRVGEILRGTRYVWVCVCVRVLVSNAAAVLQGQGQVGALQVSPDCGLTGQMLLTNHLVVAYLFGWEMFLNDLLNSSGQKKGHDGTSFLGTSCVCCPFLGANPKPDSSQRKPRGWDVFASATCLLPLGQVGACWGK